MQNKGKSNWKQPFMLLLMINEQCYKFIPAEFIIIYCMNNVLNLFLQPLWYVNNVMNLFLILYMWYKNMNSVAFMIKKQILCIYFCSIYDLMYKKYYDLFLLFFSGSFRYIHIAASFWYINNLFLQSSWWYIIQCCEFISAAFNGRV